MVAAAIAMGVLGGWGLRRWVDAREEDVAAPPSTAPSPMLAVRATPIAPDGALTPTTLVRYWSRSLGPSVGFDREWYEPMIAEVSATNAIEFTCPRPGTGEHVRFVVQTRTEPPVEGTFELDGPFGGAVFDAGRVELRPVEIIALGRVLDVNGDPVTGARVELESELAPTAIPTAVATHAWDTGPRRATYSGAGGVFGFASSERISRIRVRATVSDGDSTDWLELGGPSRLDCRIEFPPTATVSGRVLVAPDIPLESLHVLISPPREPRVPGARFRGISLAADGTWSFAGVSVGAQRAIEIIADSSSYILARSEPFVVASAGVEVPPLDLSDVHVLDLTVVDEHGTRIEDVGVMFRATATDEWAFCFDGDEHPRIWTRGPDTEVWLGASGRRDAHLERVTTGQRIVLLPATKVRVSIGPTGRLPTSNRVLAVGLVPLAVPDGIPRDWLGFVSGVAVDAAGHVELDASGVGTHELKLCYREGTSDATRDRPFWSTRVEIGEGPTQDVAIEVGADVVAAAKELLEKL